MQQDVRESRDCKLVNITVQLSLYAFMIESLFANVVVDEAVAVFCNDGGHSEYAVNRPQDSTDTYYRLAERLHAAGQAVGICW